MLLSGFKGREISTAIITTLLRSAAHIVLQTLQDLDAIVAQVQLAQIHKILETFNLQEAITLGRKELTVLMHPNRTKPLLNRVHGPGPEAFHLKCICIIIH